MKSLPNIPTDLVDEYLDDLRESDPATYYTGGIRLLQRMTKQHIRRLRKTNRCPFSQKSIDAAVKYHLSENAALFGGKLVSMQLRGTRYGEKNGMFRKHHTDAAKKKLSEHSFAKRMKDAYWKYKANNGPLKWQDFLKLKV